MRLIHDSMPVAGGASLFGVDEGHQGSLCRQRSLRFFWTCPVFWYGDDPEVGEVDTPVTVGIAGEDERIRGFVDHIRRQLISRHILHRTGRQRGGGSGVAGRPVDVTGAAPPSWPTRSVIRNPLLSPTEPTSSAFAYCGLRAIIVHGWSDRTDSAATNVAHERFDSINAQGREGSQMLNTALRHCLASLAAMGLILLASAASFASEVVTVDNFVRAETDTTFDRYVKQGGFGKFLHIRQPTPIDKQDVIRMNRDTLYSAGVFDLTEPVTIVKPDSGGRFQSMMVINQDHSMLPIEHGAGEFTFTKEKVGTRYAIVLFRTFVDANDPEDVKAANALQDKIAVRQAKPGEFEIPDWDEPSLKKVRDAINVLAATRTSAKGMFGDKAKLDPISHLLGTAFGWGGNPDDAAVYDNVVPTKNDGTTPYRLTVKDVPVNGFWSVTVYNKAGFMEKNDQNVYSYNNVTARKNADGSITINFGGGPDAINNLPITPGWNYIVRMYQPKPEIIKGLWSFPKAQSLE